MAKRRKTHTTKEKVVVRSNFEVDCLNALDREHIPYEYESLRFSYVSHHTYTPDLSFPNNIVVELKGRFLPADRAKILAVRKAHPHIDLRMVFMNPNVKLSKNSRTTYGDWCDKHGIQWASKRVPIEWTSEAGTQTWTKE